MDHHSSALNSAFWTFSSNAMELDSSNGLNFLESESFSSRPSRYCPNYRKEMGNSLSENSTPVYLGIEEHVIETPTSLLHPVTTPLEDCESSRRWSIEGSHSVKGRLMLAIECLKQYVEGSDVLIQIWVPTMIGGQNVLTTIDQPCSFNPDCKSLASYRNVSKTFHLTAEEDLKASAGLPGRVFLRQLPEWTPDVRFFRSDECPRKDYAKLYNISGCLALPVFELDSGICLAVVEIVTTTQKISYHLELEIVCRALEAVDLKSSQDFFPFSLKAYNGFYQIAVAEISEILQSVCKTHSLPLALTWAFCDRQGESEYQQFPEKYDYCISIVDSACYVAADSDLVGFIEACSKQYLFLDQGIVGKAFTTNKQWFATDITSFSKTSYPLSHYARMFNLHAALTIPLRNMYTGLVEFVLEIFLPRDCKDVEEQMQMWDLLPAVVQQACQNFNVIMDKEMDDEVNEQVVLTNEGIQKLVSPPSPQYSPEELSWTACQMDAPKNDKFAFVSWDYPKEEPEEEFKVITHWNRNGLDLYQEQDISENSMFKLSVKGGENASIGQHCSLNSRRAGDKRPTKTEKIINLQILRQYFAGSLKNAAKCIGVCPTTLKRICRQHGISRWPSRKIKKVNHSLRKLQLVVNSIHGVEGLIQIDSFYKTFPELNSGKDHFSSFKISDSSKKSNPQPESLPSQKGPVSKSQSSSCSQNSGSSTCDSTEAKQLTATTSTNDLKTGCSLPAEDPVAALKRTCTEAELHYLNQELPSLPDCITHSSRDGLAFRIKATFGEENIRFSFLPSWSFKDLQKEIAKRFKIDDFSRIDLKYIDIDHEPVLLTCDADLDECIDLLRLSETNTIKISLHQASQPNLGSSFRNRLGISA